MKYSVSLLKEAYGIWRNSFKQFLFIPKTTSTEVVYQMIGVDLVELVIKSKKIAQEKWTARKQHTDCLIDETLKIPRYNPLIGISNIFCQIIKLEARKCIACKREGKSNILTQHHLASDHNIDIFGYKRMWIEIRDHFIIKKKQTENKPLIRLKRLEFQKKWDNVLDLILKDTEEKTRTLNT